MWPALRNGVLKILFDETAFLRWSRSAIMAAAFGGMSFADQVAEALGAPGAVKTIKVVSVACAGLALLFGAGDKTPQDVKDAAKVITSSGHKVAP